MSKILLPNPYILTEEDIRSRSHIRSLANQAGEMIGKYKNKLRMMAIADPKTFVPEEEDPLNYVSEKVDEVIGDILDQSSIIDRADFYDMCLDRWKYNKEDEGLKDSIDTDTDEGFNRVVVNENSDSDKYRKKYPNYFDLRNFDSMNDYYKLCFDTQDERRKPQEMWVIYTGNTLLIEKDGRYVYPSREIAVKALKDHFGLNDGHNIFTKSWLKNNPKFVEDFVQHFGVEDGKRFREYIDHIISGEKLNMQEFEALWKAFNDIIDDAIESWTTFVNIAEKQ